MKSFSLEILTPEKKIFSGQVTKLTVRAADGEIGVLPNHAPLATVVTPGPIDYQLDSGEEVRRDDGWKGFLIVGRNSAVLLQAT